MIIITIDVDWSPDPIMDEIVALLDKKRIPATLYCTDPLTDVSGKSSSLHDRYHSRYELGLHPNFMKSLNYDEIWKNLKDQYPNAVGYRSHQGCSGAPTIFSSLKHGVLYEVSCFVPSVYVPPFKFNEMYSDFVVFMTYFFDSKKLHHPGYGWELDTFAEKINFLDPNKLFIFGFHPNILYYDMSLIEEYYIRKSSYHIVKEKDSFKFKKNVGAMKLFKELISAYSPEAFTTVKNFLFRDSKIEMAISSDVMKLMSSSNLR